MRRAEGPTERPGKESSPARELSGTLAELTSELFVEGSPAVWTLHRIYNPAVGAGLRRMGS